MFWTDIAKHITIAGMVIGLIISMFTFSNDFFATIVQMVVILFVGTVIMVLVEAVEGIYKSNEKLNKLIEIMEKNRSVSERNEVNYSKYE